MMQRRWLWLLTMAFAIVASACGGSSADDEPIVILAASSLTDVLPTIADEFTVSTRIPVDVSFAGSSTLREQILEGAPADIFISANPAIMAELAQVGLIDREIVSIATNTIVIAAPADNPGAITGLDSLADPDAVVGLCAPDVPCGLLGQAVLDAAGVEASVDTFEPSVRALLAKVELGEVDAGLVYDTDVRASTEVVAIGEPFSDAGETTYVAASLVGSGESGERFIEFLGGDIASTILDDAGFGTP